MFTYGITAEVRSFEFHDDWTKPERAHMALDEPWVGYTVFTERSEEYMATQKGNLCEAPVAARASTSRCEAPVAARASTSRWADV